MSLHQRLLALTTSLLDDCSRDFENFASSFASVRDEVYAAKCAGSLTEEDQILSLGLSRGVELIASTFLHLDKAEKRGLKDLRSAVSLDLGECRDRRRLHQ